MSLVPIYGNPGDLVIAYRIDTTDPPFKQERSCARNQFGIWEVSPLK